MVEAADWRVTLVNIVKTTHYHKLGLQNTNYQRCKHLKHVPYLFALLKKGDYMNICTLFCLHKWSVPLPKDLLP
jgi:hypothetical protein